MRGVANDWVGRCGPEWMCGASNRASRTNDALSGPHTHSHKPLPGDWVLSVVCVCWGRDGAHYTQISSAIDACVQLIGAQLKFGDWAAKVLGALLFGHGHIALFGPVERKICPPIPFRPTCARINGFIRLVRCAGFTHHLATNTWHGHGYYLSIRRK